MTVERFDTSVGELSHSRGRYYHARRLVRHFVLTYRLLRLRQRRSIGVVYHVPNGGAGMVYSTWLAILCQFLRIRMVLHHRSYGYIDRYRLSAAIFFRIASSKATHVFLSHGMSRAFQQEYGPVSWLVVSNRGFLDVVHGNVRTGKKPLVLGHLSNLCAEKGLFEVFGVFEELKRSGYAVKLRIAGRPVNNDVAASLATFKERFGADVELYGQLYGVEKRRFYSEVDIFCFPTRYHNEAQPNVIYEALAAGCPVVALDRGCIGEMVPPSAGCVVSTDAEFVTEAANWIKRLIDEGPKRIEAISKKALECVRLGKDEADSETRRLLEVIRWPEAGASVSGV